MSKSLGAIMSADWAEAMEPVAGQIHQMGDFLRGEISAGRGYFPPGDQVFRAFSYPLSQVKVLVVGQDPYPTPGHAIGLSFAVAPGVRPLPKSLQNIYREYAADLNLPLPSTGDLRPWAAQGVMLLNRVLTVQPAKAGSHRQKGWEAVTEHSIRVLVERDAPLVAVLWGNDARSLKPILGGKPVVESAHPSPLSASRGFFGSRPFSRVNRLLSQQGVTPVDWRLP